MAKIRTLRRCSLFRNLTFRELAILAHHMEESAVPQDRWLIEEGSYTNGLTVIKSGKVHVSIPTHVNGHLELGTGDFFGELSIFEVSKERLVGVKSVEKCEFLRMSSGEYQKLQDAAPEVASKVAQGILERFAQKMVATKEVLKRVAQQPRGEKEHD